MPETPAAAPVAALADDLAAAPYTIDALAAAWGPMAAEALGRDDPEPARAALARRPASVPGLLGGLFVLGDPAPVTDLDRVLPRCGTEGAVRLGLVESADGEARPLVDLRPYGIADETGVASWWIVSDQGELVTGGELREDHVLGAGAASATLAQITVPTGAGAVLDLGTGSGVQALIAARTASRVVGTDVSRRALGFARLNAALNGVELDLREGSLYEPVAGERFDRILSNPPFVITPRDAAEVPAYTYRDGGFRGDGLVEAVVRGAAAHLAEGGIAQLLGNWEVHHGDLDAARQRVLDWAGPLDVWVVERDLLDPAQYAETWVRDGGAQPGTTRFRMLVRAWLDDFAERDVTAIGAGYLTLRSGAGAPLRRFEHLDGPVGSGVGAAIAAGLAAHDRLALLGEAGLSGQRLRVAADVTEHRHHWPGEPDPTVIELRQGTGFARVRRVDTVVAAVVGACDGELPVGRLIDAVARLLEAEPAATRDAALPVLRELLLEGFLAFA